jgi:hypothetical protein
MRRNALRSAMAVSMLCVSTLAQSQSACQFIGLRVLKRVWLEEGLGVMLAPVQPFDAGAAGCINNASALIPFSHPHFKELYSAALAALASGTPIDSYICGCASNWGTTFPSVLNFGVGPP